MHSHHSIMIVGLATLAAGTLHVASVKRSKSAKYYGRSDSGRYRMPGHMMTKAGKRYQMQKDFQSCNRRKGKPR